MGDCFKFLWPFQNVRTLSKNEWLPRRCCILWIDIAWGLQKLGITLKKESTSKFKVIKTWLLFIYIKICLTKYFIDNKDNFWHWLWKLKIHQFEVPGSDEFKLKFPKLSQADLKWFWPELSRPWAFQFWAETEPTICMYINK